MVSLYVCFGLASWQLFIFTTPAPIAYAAPTKEPPAPIYVDASISGKPAVIIVPRLNVELAVIDGAYNRTNDSWTLSDDKAQFATMTTQPNDQRGNTFIYGHNTDRVFAKLSGLQNGDIAKVKTTNGYTFSYVYSGNDSVQPTNTSVLSENPAKPQLTLMTCEGLFSQTRRMMYFDFKEVI